LNDSFLFDNILILYFTL